MRKILAYLLCLCLLTAGTGVPVYAHTCFHSGITNVSLAPSACKMHRSMPDHHACLHKSPCCTLKYSFHKTVIQANNTGQKLISFAMPAMETAFSQVLPVSHPCSFIFTGSSPPLLAANAQVSYGVFRI